MPWDVSDSYLPALKAVLRVFGKSADVSAMLAGLPLRGGELTADFLAEAAERADVSAAAYDGTIAAITRTQLPMIVSAVDYGPVALLTRHANGFTAARGPDETFWLPDDAIDAAAPMFRLAPAYYFDQRSELLDLERPHQWFRGSLFANRPLYGYAILAGLFVNLAAIAISLFTMAVYDRVIPNNALSSLVALLIGIIVIVLTDAGMRLVRGYLVDAAGRRFDVSVGARIFRQLLAMRGATRPQSAGTLANSVRDFETVREFFTSATLVTLGDVPFVLLFLAIIFWIGGWLVLVPLAAICVLVGAGLLLQRPIHTAVAQAHREAAHKSAFLHEAMAGIDTIKAVNAQAWARRHWEAIIARNAETSLVSRQCTSFSGSLSSAVMNFVTIGTVALGAVLVAEGMITSGALIAAVILAGRTIQPFVQVAGLMARWQQTRLAVESLDTFMTAPGEEKSGQLQHVAAKGALSFRNVTFSYPPAADDVPPQTALEGVSFEIEAGSCVAILGRVGSGKSTALRLALNLDEPQSGHVLLDGVDVRQYHPAALRAAIGYAGQEAVLFHGTIRDNILAARPGLSDAELLAAARTAGLDDLLSRSVTGLQTPVGERGARLSGGERQAVSLARALAGQPPVLLLDEPTSAMDNTTEQRVIAGLAEARRGLTTLIVTHKPALLPLASRIIVLDQGKVVMDGPRDAVLARLTGKPPQQALNVVTQTAH
jgi:ATP-binding cassette subfamily C protein LapB